MATNDNARQLPTALQFSDAGIALLKLAEGCALKPYDDQTGRETAVWVKGATIGVGHLILENEWPRYAGGFSMADAEALLRKDLGPTLSDIRSTIKVPVLQQEFDALVFLVFNIGGPNFAGSSVAKLINNPAATTSFPSLEAAWKSWNKSQGKEMAGLNNRRQCEWKIYSQGVYERW